MKTCTKCGQTKPLGEFHRDSSKGDGHLPSCKLCKSSQSAQYRKDNPEKAKASDRRWRLNNLDKERESHQRYYRENGDRVRANVKRWQAENPERVSGYHRDWGQKNRKKRQAHKAVSTAIIRGALVRQPCEVCGTSENVHGHHDDYDKPLDVRWLCHDHHMEHHANT